jgi:hypothetical protein
VLLPHQKKERAMFRKILVAVDGVADADAALAQPSTSPKANTPN